MKQPPEEPNIILPLSGLRALMFGQFGDHTIPDVKPLSITVGDLAKPLVTHWTLGAFIAEVDSSEDYFHVEKYPATMPITGVLPDKAHAEIWLISEWRESNARRTKIKARCEAENKILDETRDMVDLIADELTTLRIPEDACRTLAKTIVANYKTHDLRPLAKELGFLHVLEKYLPKQ